MPAFMPILKGKAVADFEKYQKRPGTPEEIKYMQNAETFYRLHRV